MKRVLFSILLLTVLYSKDTNYEKIFSEYYSTRNIKYLKDLGIGVRNKNPLALYYTGLIYDKLMNGIKNKNIAKSFYKDSIKEFRKINNKNIKYPLYALGLLYMYEKNYTEGIKLLSKCSDLSYHKATLYLIRFYEIEYFNNPKSLTKKKLKVIIELYHRLLQSKKYRSDALAGLGRWYINSPFKEFTNYDLGLKYSLEAANNYHNIDAYNNLVTIYRYRDTKYKDINKSYHWKTMSIIEYLTKFKEKSKEIISMPNWKRK